MATTRQVALLRAINLGSRRRVGMGDLRQALSGLGYGDVHTYLQSGNVVLTAEAKGKRLERELEERLVAELGMDTRVIVRTRAELAKVVARDPLGAVAKNPSRYLVTFLAEKPDPKRVRELGALDVKPEQFVISGREIYAWHPRGMQRSPLSKALGDGLGVVGTARNWNTVTKLLELAGE